MENTTVKNIILTVTTIIGILVIMTSHSEAQSVKLTTYMEYTHISPKAGTSAGYLFENNFGAGIFYQKEVLQGFTEEIPTRREKKFWGAYFALPVIYRAKYDAGMQLRAGVVNTEGFTITPSFHFTYRPVPFIGISAGVGMRNLRPSVMPRLEITF